jgi:hypothetical protein
MLKSNRERVNLGRFTGSSTCHFIHSPI